MKITISFTSIPLAELGAYITMIVIGSAILNTFGIYGLILLIGGSICLFFGFILGRFIKLTRNEDD